MMRPRAWIDLPKALRSVLRRGNDPANTSHGGRKFFRLVRSGIDVAPLLAEIREQEQAWLINTSRQDAIPVQRHTNTIFIRSAVRRPDLNINENQESRFTRVSKLFPKAIAFMSSFASEMNCELSRATIVRLEPKSRVSSHIDAGSYYLLRNRYHLVLYSSGGSVLISGDEQVRMKEGEVWWFNNKQYHEARNESDQWRIHYIFDLLPSQHRQLAINPILATPKRFQRRQPPAQDKNSKRSTRDQLFATIRDQAVLHGDRQRLVGRNGTENTWLIDMRRVLTQADALDAAAGLFFEMCADLMPFQVGGMEVAAIPLLAAILMKSIARGTPVNGFIVRKERKTYGTGRLIEGKITNEPIIILDDILNSGRSLEKVRVVLKREKKDIALVFAVVDYQSEKGETWRARHRIPVRAPFSLRDFNLAPRPPAAAPPSEIFEEVWDFASPDPNFFHRVPKSFPTTDGERVYFGSDCGFLWCLDANTGSVIWKFKVNARGHKNLWSSPALHGGRVFFGSYDGNVYCVAAETGEEIWRFTGAEWIGSSPALAPELGLLFIGLEHSIQGKRGSIVALHLDTGERVWEHLTKRYTHASPAYWPERQVVACGSNDNEMFMFDARTGSMHWRFETRGAGGRKGSIRHAPAFDGKRGRLVTGCADGCIYIVDVETGKEVWSVQTDNTIYTVPLVLDDTAYVGSTDKHLYVLDLEQRAIKEQLYVDSKIFGPASLLAGRIYFGACNGILYEMDPVTARVTGTHQLPDAVTNALTYNPRNGYFYALTYVNHLFALRRLETPGPRDGLTPH
jgi:outer membrane protein assembly factor BamB/orotate phosphoribosyltransferase